MRERERFSSVELTTHVLVHEEQRRVVDALRVTVPQNVRLRDDHIDRAAGIGHDRKSLMPKKQAAASVVVLLY